MLVCGVSEMGKCTKRGDVALMELSHGVRTRAKTLALLAVAGAPSRTAEYIQLRSRRLEKNSREFFVGKNQMSERFLGEGFCTISDDCRSVCLRREEGSGSGGVIRNVMEEERNERRMPSAVEMDEFFEDAEREQRWEDHIQLLSKKYNFDFLGGVPFHGRYKWTKIHTPQ